LLINTPSGQIGILKSHMPMVAAVSIGTISIKINGEWKDAVLSEGFMEIIKDKVVVLVDTAEWPEEIDINRAKRAEERARERLSSKINRMEYAYSQAALQKAIIRIKAYSGKNKN
ncbi:MAG: ATP synthase F1 subunit epsilon, partial [Oscillospiraceae bacterium]